MKDSSFLMDLRTHFPLGFHFSVLRRPSRRPVCPVADRAEVWDWATRGHAPLKIGMFATPVQHAVLILHNQSARQNHENTFST